MHFLRGRSKETGEIVYVRIILWHDFSLSVLFVIVKSFKNMLRAVTNDNAKLLEITFLFLYLAIVRLMCNGLHQQNFC